MFLPKTLITQLEAEGKKLVSKLSPQDMQKLTEIITRGKGHYLKVNQAQTITDRQQAEADVAREAHNARLLIEAVVIERRNHIENLAIETVFSLVFKGLAVLAA